MTTGTYRPRFLALYRLQFPVGAICSIGHRISGVTLALFTPLAIYFLGLSLEGPRGYSHAAAVLGSLPGRAAIALFVWAFAHHVLAGVRHLLTDVDIGSSLEAARRSAWMVNVFGVLVALLAAGAILR